MNEKILLAEDEAELARAEKAILEFNKYNVTLVENGLLALEQTKEVKFDVIIMDVMMPVMDGITAVKKIRSSGIETPIILLTAKSQVDDKVEGLDAGANDYLTKPFNRKELLARIRALTRTNTAKKEKYCIGNITFNKELSEISNSKAVFHLNNKECEIMDMLVNNQERSISASEFCKKVWADSSSTPEMVNMYISYLQNKFVALNSNIRIKDDGGYALEKII